MKRGSLTGEWFVRGWMILCLTGVLWMAWGFARAQESEQETENSVPGPAAVAAPPVDESAETNEVNSAQAGAVISPATDSGDAPAPVADPTFGRRMVQSLDSRGFVERRVNKLSFGLAQVPELQVTLFGKPLWQYLATVIYVLLAFLISKSLDWVIKYRLQVWATEKDSKWGNLLVGLANGPVKVISFVVLLHVGLQLFDWPIYVQGYVTKLTSILVAFSIIYVMMRAVDTGITLWVSTLKDDGDRAFNQQFLNLVGRLIKSVIVIIAFLTLLDNLGVQITTILGGVSILGLALGLAAQDTVGNLFGAVAVFMDRPFRVGDRIKIGGDVDGFVEQIGLRATRVRTLEGHLVTVPNKAVGANTVINISRRTSIRASFAVGVTYNTPSAKVKRAVDLLEEIYRAHPNTQDVIVHFNRFADYFLNLDILYWCRSTDWKVFCATVQDLNLTIKERFDAEGIEFAFPTRTLHVHSETRDDHGLAPGQGSAS